jgi:hypothetical protein
MNISTYNELFVEKLYLNGVEFNVDNFKGESGTAPTIDPDAIDLKGPDGDDWTLRYETINVLEDDVGVLTLPDPSSEDYDFTAIQITKNIVTTGNITIMTHDNRFMGKLYGPHVQNLHLIRSTNNIWIK